VIAGLRLRELLDRLTAAEVRFVIVGGLAVNAWGHVRGTLDVDLVPDPDRGNLDRLASVLEEAGGRVETAQGRLAASAIRTFLAAGDRTLVATELGPVDVLQGLPQIPPFSQLDAEAVAVDLGGTVVRVCSLETLLAMKRASDRPRDRDDLEALEAAHSSGEREPDD
jgi:predicted nucleotidyltransferase